MTVTMRDPNVRQCETQSGGSNLYALASYKPEYQDFHPSPAAARRLGMGKYLRSPIAL